MANQTAKIPTHRRGYTMVELTLVMLLLALFGITIMTLIQSGSTAYDKIAKNRTAESNARVAIGYIDVRMRQNDQRGSITLKPNPLGDGSALVIREMLDGSDYYTWIYFAYDADPLTGEQVGALYECNLLLKDELPSLELSQRISSLDSFTFELLENGAIRQTATYTYQTDSTPESHQLSSVIALRTGGALDE